MGENYGKKVYTINGIFYIIDEGTGKIKQFSKKTSKFLRDIWTN